MRSDAPGIGAGSCGFSWNPVIRPSRSVVSTPKAEASASGTGRAATVTSAPDLRWKSIIWRMSMR